VKEIAIVGLAARFPGATDAGAFWRLTMSAKPRFGTIPANRWNHASFFDPDSRRDRDIYRSYTDQVAFLDDVYQFAPTHYRIPPRRARAMDPQHRLFIDLVREALADAGWERRPFDRAGTGVYFGLSQSDYWSLTVTRLRATLLADGSLHGGRDDPDLRAALERVAEDAVSPVGAYGLPGCLPNMAAGTVSNLFDLGGPSFTVDAACASSLIALGQAVTALRAGLCSTALVGGVFLNLSPDEIVGFSNVGALSVSGVCRPFDERADGFVLGEGGGVLVLRPLADALAAGDRVYAVVRGIGVSNDGRAEGPMTPSPEGQLAALRAAYADADVDPATVGMIEAHGTATPVGDQVEIESLHRLRAGTGPALLAAPAALTSTKAILGHSLTAAGGADPRRAAAGRGRPAHPDGTNAAARPARRAGAGRDQLFRLRWHQRPRRAGGRAGPRPGRRAARAPTRRHRVRRPGRPGPGAPGAGAAHRRLDRAAGRAR
jgi:acyl transferase domain-containing protein